jgi:hypothetical protein
MRGGVLNIARGFIIFHMTTVAESAREFQNGFNG